MNKKRTIGIIVCIVLVSTMLISVCACIGIPDSVWKSVGLTKSTLSLPKLQSCQMRSVRGNDRVAMSILWSGGTENDFNSLAEECFTKIPANIDTNGNVVSSIDDMIHEDDEMIIFYAIYSVGGDKYNCSVIYFKDSYVGEDPIDDAETIIYQKNQILLVIDKKIVQTGSKNSWDIDSDDKTWFTQDELTALGLEGLQAPQGNILGKIVSDVDIIAVRMSIEIASNEIYYNFIQELFENYNMNLSSMDEVVESYDDKRIYISNKNFAGFSPCYKVDEKIFQSQIILDNGHIVIEIAEVNN